VLNGSQVQADSFAPNPLQANGQPPMMQQEPMDSRFAPVIENLRQRFPHFSTERVLLVDTTAQHMFLIERGRPIADWIISTAEKGVGSLKGSDQTPLGVHRIAEKIGAGAPFGMIFKSRQPTGEIVQILSAPNAESKADYVTSRILWLDGLEPGINQGGDVDSKERFIYIHGTGEEGKLGTPASHGCIRMRNQDVIELFDQVNENTLVVITRQHQDR
jgi:hypothetical protein